MKNAHQFIVSLLQNKDVTIDQSLLHQALTHKSYAVETTGIMRHNQRLEFLGDSVLGLIIANQLYLDHTNFDEAQLTLWKISLVREETLFDVAKEIDLDKHILIGKGEDRKWGRDNPAILWDALEALIGYIYVDLWYEIVRQFVLDHVYSKKNTIHLVWSKGWKSLLQEKLQELYKQLPIYHDEEVSRNDKTNFVEYQSTVYLEDRKLGEGRWSNKKKAQEEAARDAYEQITDSK
jgi:ribonuclease-3